MLLHLKKKKLLRYVSLSGNKIMVLNRFLMLISIVKSIWLEMTTVSLWFVRKVQIFHGHLQIYLTVTKSKFDKLVRNSDKNVIWNTFYAF